MGVGSGARVENADVLGLGGRALLSAESGGSGLGGGLDGPVTAGCGDRLAARRP